MILGWQTLCISVNTNVGNGPIPVRRLSIARSVRWGLLLKFNIHGDKLPAYSGMQESLNPVDQVRFQPIIAFCQVFLGSIASCAHRLLDIFVSSSLPGTLNIANANRHCHCPRSTGEPRNGTFPLLRQDIQDSRSGRMPAVRTLDVHKHCGEEKKMAMIDNLLLHDVHQSTLVAHGSPNNTHQSESLH